MKPIATVEMAGTGVHFACPTVVKRIVCETDLGVLLAPLSVIDPTPNNKIDVRDIIKSSTYIDFHLALISPRIFSSPEYRLLQGAIAEFTTKRLLVNYHRSASDVKQTVSLAQTEEEMADRAKRAIMYELIARDLYFGTIPDIGRYDLEPYAKLRSTELHAATVDIRSEVKTHNVPDTVVIPEKLNELYFEILWYEPET